MGWTPHSLNSSLRRMSLHARPKKKVHFSGAWQPSEANTYADVEACFDWLRKEKGTREEDIILYGQSVGSGPTCDLASQRPHLRGVILHSPILSGVRVLYEVKRTYWFDVFKVGLRYTKHISRHEGNTWQSVVSNESAALLPPWMFCSRVKLPVRLLSADLSSACACTRRTSIKSDLSTAPFSLSM